MSEDNFMQILQSSHNEAVMGDGLKMILTAIMIALCEVTFNNAF